MKDCQPENPEAEQSVLGASMLRPQALEVAADLLLPEDLTGGNALIFKAILDLRDAGVEPDLVSVSQKLIEAGKIEAAGGAAYLADLTDNVGTAANIGHHAQIVWDYSQARKLLEKIRIIQATKPNGNMAEWLAFAESQILEVTEPALANRSQQVIPASLLLGADYPRDDEIIAEGILPRGGGLIIAGESGVGKSLMRTELAVHLVMGWDLWGLRIPTARKVLIFQFENTEAQEAHRLKEMVRGLGITDFPDKKLFYNPPRRIDLGKVEDRARVARAIRVNGAEVVVYDPLTSIHQVNENDNVLIRGILDNITEINRRTGASAVVCHHFGKPTERGTIEHRTRGASSIRDWADTLLAVTRKNHEHKTLRLLEFIKVRNGPEPKKILLERGKDLLHHVTEEDMLCPPERVRALLEGLGGKVDSQKPLEQAIMSSTDCTEKTARTYISLAVERHAIRYGKHPQDKRKKIYYVGD